MSAWMLAAGTTVLGVVIGLAVGMYVGVRMAGACGFGDDPEDWWL
jgi:hypothetical protein